MRMGFAIVSALLLCGLVAFAQEKKEPTKPPATAPSVIPMEAAKVVNPVKSTPNSIAEGRRVYNIDCAMCHGTDGGGKGDLAKDMNLNLRDYRDPSSLKDMTDGTIFYIIKNGKGDMPGEGDRMKPDDLWNMVNYIRSLGKKEAASKPHPEKPQ